VGSRIENVLDDEIVVVATGYEQRDAQRLKPHGHALHPVTHLGDALLNEDLVRGGLVVDHSGVLGWRHPHGVLT
jgi:hypothetical protein